MPVNPPDAAPPSPPLPDRIRAAGRKVTPGRMRVLDLLCRAHQPLSHAQIETLLEAEAALRMDRVTLYRILDSLTTAGLLLKGVDARGIFRFSGVDAARAHESHVHFRCQTCDGVFCLDARPPRAPELPSGFRLSAVEFDLRGTCPQCAADAV